MSRIIFIMLLCFKISFAGAEEWGCQTDAQNLDISTLKTQGYEIKNTFSTYVLVSQYGNSKDFQLMPAYELRNKDGDVKFATCKGLYSSPYRYGEYIINDDTGAYVKIEPWMTVYYEQRFKGIRITGNADSSSYIVDFNPYYGPLNPEDFKVNSIGEISEILLYEKPMGVNKPSKKIFYNSTKIVNPSCLNLNPPPFVTTVLTYSATVKNVAENKNGYDIALAGLLEKFNQAKEQCNTALGKIEVCKQNQQQSKYKKTCWYNNLISPYDGEASSGIFKQIDYTQSGRVVTTTLTSPEVNCIRFPWTAAVVNKCELKSIPKTSPADQNIRIIEITDSAMKEDIVVPEEIIVPPGDVSFKLVNHSSFTVTFKGSTMPAEGYLKKYKYGQVPEEAVVLKAMPGNVIKLSPYDNKFHFIRFKN